jgi:hypothetical protein
MRWNAFDFLDKSKRLAQSDEKILPMTLGWLDLVKSALLPWFEEDYL